jgi:hypothetical protein
MYCIRFRELNAQVTINITPLLQMLKWDIRRHTTHGTCRDKTLQPGGIKTPYTGCKLYFSFWLASDNNYGYLLSHPKHQQAVPSQAPASLLPARKTTQAREQASGSVRNRQDTSISHSNREEKKRRN